MESLISCKRQTYSWHQVRHAASQHSKREWNQRSQRGVDADVPFISPIKKMKPQFHFNCCTISYDERTWNRNEQNGILLHLLHVKCFMYIVQWSTKHHPSPSFFYYLYKKVLLCIAKCSIVEHSKVGFFFFHGEHWNGGRLFDESPHWMKGAVY